jgi:hypothetical protein
MDSDRKDRWIKSARILNRRFVGLTRSRQKRHVNSWLGTYENRMENWFNYIQLHIDT